MSTTVEHVIDFGGDPVDVTVTLSGDPSLEGWRTYFEALLADDRFRPGMPILVDLSALDPSALSADDVRQMGTLVRRYTSRLAPSRRAIVAPDPLSFGFSRMAQARSDPDAEYSRVFRTREDAIAWLLEA